MSNQSKRLTTIKKEEEDLICICGNTPDTHGFYPCDSEGEYVEPTPQEWTTDWYVCDLCGRIIDPQSLRVVGCRFSNTLSSEERKAIMDEVQQYCFPPKL